MDIVKRNDPLARLLAGFLGHIMRTDLTFQRSFRFRCAESVTTYSRDADCNVCKRSRAIDLDESRGPADCKSRGLLRYLEIRAPPLSGFHWNLHLSNDL